MSYEVDYLGLDFHIRGTVVSEGMGRTGSDRVLFYSFC